MAATHTLGIDLGGTNIKGGVCDADGRLIATDSVETQAHAGFDHVFRRIVGLVERLPAGAGLGRERILGVGIGAPGPMSHSRGMILNAPNLPGWENIPLRDRLSDAVGLRVSLENDANAAAFGEFVAGAGQDVQTMVMVTLGTGIGGGVILDGRLWRGHFDNAGEIGHAIVVPGGRACPCGKLGCLERYASANAVGERLIEAVKAGGESALAAKVAAGASITSRDVLDQRRNGDALAARIWDETCYYLAIGCINIQHHFNPQRIVLAGGLINAGDELLAPLRDQYRRLAWKMCDDFPEIVFAQVGTDAGTIGAGALARQEFGAA